MCVYDANIIDRFTISPSIYLSQIYMQKMYIGCMYIYAHNYMTIYNDIYICVLQYPNDVNMSYDVICIMCMYIYIYISFSYKIIHMDCTS